MESILITSNNKSEIDLVRKLVKKMGISFISLNDENQEDLALLQAMLKADRAQKVDEKTVMAKIEEKCR